MDRRMEMQQKIQGIKEEMVGSRYRHFKGGVYIVSGIAVHSETEEPMVIYKNFDDPTFVWARPLSMFLSEVDHAKYPEVKQKFRFERLDGERTRDLQMLKDLPKDMQPGIMTDSKPDQALIKADEPKNIEYFNDPMPLEKQWASCDENGVLEGNILMGRDVLYKGELDEDEVLDLMSERLTGDPGMKDLTFSIVGENADHKVIVHVRGNIAERSEFTEELEAVCERIKSAVIANGDDAISDFLDASAAGRTAKELEQAIDDVMDAMPLLELIRYFKKYVVSDVTSEAGTPDCARFLTPERIDTPNVDGDFADSAKQNEKFPIAGLQFCPEDYMTSAGLKKLTGLLDSGEFEILQIDGTSNASSYFLVSSEVYQNLEVADVNEFEAFVREILDDLEKETPDGQYMWRDHRVYLGYL